MISKSKYFRVTQVSPTNEVYNYNTHEKVTSFEAHVDYIRCIAVHHTHPFILTCSDDMKIKLWDWEKGWKNIMVFGID
jgi:coatomer subunit beta'